MTVTENLQAARDLITDSNKWTQFAVARNSNNESTTSRNPDAVCWCALGALEYTHPRDQKSRDLLNIMTYLDSFMNGSVSIYNNNHTHEEVLAAFDRAIEASKEVELGN